MFSTGKITPAWVLAHNGPTEMDKNYNCPPDIHSIDSDWWTRATFCISGTKVSSEPVTNKSQHVWIISLCEMHNCLTNGYKPFWGKAREEHLQCKISVIRQDLSSWMTQPMLHSRDFRFVSINKLSAGKWLRGMTIIVIKARLPFARKDLYHLHISSDTIILFDLFLYQGHFGQPQILC